jgi:hypothetical protein
LSKANGNKVAGVVSPYNHTGLSNGTTYYYVVTAVDGSGAESAESSQVSARPVGWSDGTQLGSEFSIYPQSVQINDTGIAVATWLGHGMSPPYVSIYQGSAWNTTVLGGSGYSSQVFPGPAHSPSVALTASGDAIAVYCQPFYDVLGRPLRTLVYSGRYSRRTGIWSAARLISVKDWSFAGNPIIAVDSNGNAIVIWNEDSQIWARRFDAALGAWETSATNLSVTYAPQRIVVDGNNIFTAVWFEHSTVFARRFNATLNTWDASVRIGNDPSVWLPSNLQVDVNTAGNVFVVWLQQLLPDTTQYSICSSRFDPVTNTWSAPAVLTASPFPAHSPRVAVDNAGNAMVAWLQLEGTRASLHRSLQTARFAATDGTWSTPMRTDQAGTDSIGIDVVLGMDGNGNAEVIWSDMAKGIIERRYDAATSTWGGFNTITPKPVTVSQLVGTMSDSGYAALLGDTTGTTWTVGAWGWIFTP